MSKLKINWINECLDEKLKASTIKELKQFLDDGDKPSQLITHTVQICGDRFGPSVHVWGNEGDDEQYHAKYYKTTQYINGNGDIIKKDEDFDRAK